MLYNQIPKNERFECFGINVSLCFNSRLSIFILASLTLKHRKYSYRPDFDSILRTSLLVHSMCFVLLSSTNGPVFDRMIGCFRPIALASLLACCETALIALTFRRKYD